YVFKLLLPLYACCRWLVGILGCASEAIRVAVAVNCSRIAAAAPFASHMLDKLADLIHYKTSLD
ncbi:MAG: hypothetical protein ACK5DE_01035, partial [Bacteroidota bacterium]